MQIYQRFFFESGAKNAGTHGLRPPANHRRTFPRFGFAPLTLYFVGFRTAIQF